MEEELKLDVSELRELMEQANRPRVKEILAEALTKLEKTPEKEGSEIEETCANTERPNNDELDMKPEAVKREKILSTSKITSYGWDQSAKFVKIYITLNKVETLPKESISLTCVRRAFKVVVQGLEGKNYQLEIQGLHSEIEPTDCTYKAKSGNLTVMLKKATQGNWSHLTAREKAAKELKKPNFNEQKDPSESIMDMMKQMYDDGDDEMKRTIAKAWTESREKQMSGEGMAGLPI